MVCGICTTSWVFFESIYDNFIYALSQFSVLSLSLPYGDLISPTDLGDLNYFLGTSVTRDSTSMFLSQKKYAMKLLDRAHMFSCNHTRTPIDTESKLGADGDHVFDPTLYRSLAVRSTLGFNYMHHPLALLWLILMQNGRVVPTY
ncbi:ribonuclease H-like domain-containing protein [Tanacetum coccineum]